MQASWPERGISASIQPRVQPHASSSLPAQPSSHAHAAGVFRGKQGNPREKAGVGICLVSESLRLGRGRLRPRPVLSRFGSVESLRVGRLCPPARVGPAPAILRGGQGEPGARKTLPLLHLRGHLSSGLCVSLARMQGRGHINRNFALQPVLFPRQGLSMSKVSYAACDHIHNPDFEHFPPRRAARRRAEATLPRTTFRGRSTCR